MNVKKSVLGQCMSHSGSWVAYSTSVAWEQNTCKRRGKTVSKNYSIELGLIQIGPSAPVAHALQTDSGKLCGRLKRVRPEVFVDKPGKLKDRQWSLHIDGNIPGVIQHINRVPFNRRDKVKAEFDKLMERDIIECVDTPSEWVLPVFTSHGKN